MSDNTLNDKKNTGKYSRGSRILAMITLVIIVFLIIAAFVCAIVGSRLYLGFLFAAVILPCLIYAFVWIRGVLDNAYGRELSTGNAEDKEKEEDKAD